MHVRQNNDKNVHALHVEVANFGHRGEKSMEITVANKHQYF